MNFASSGPLVSAWLDARANRRESPELHQLGRWIGWMSLVALVGGILLGLGQGILLWLDGQSGYFTAIQQLWDSKIIYGVIELVFSAACMAGYLAWWKWGTRGKAWQRYLSRLLPILAATNLLYHFPTLFTIMGMLARGETSLEGPIDSAAFRELLVQPRVIWFTIHFWLASLATATLVAAEHALARLPETEAQKCAGRAFSWTLGATLLQIPTGFMLTTTLGPAQQARLMGGDILCSVLFGLGIGSSLWLLYQLGELALFEPNRRKSRMALGLLAATVVSMTAFLLLSRESA